MWGEPRIAYAKVVFNVIGAIWKGAPRIPETLPSHRRLDRVSVDLAWNIGSISQIDFTKLFDLQLVISDICYSQLMRSM